MDFLGGYDDTGNIVTPESLAWKLLMDDDVEKFAGVLLPCVSGDKSDLKGEVAYDSLVDQFQILITIYMEMVFGSLKINHVSSLLNGDGDLDENVDVEKTFNPDLSQVKVKDMAGIFKEKLQKIRVFLSVNEIEDTDKENSKDFGYYYCRIILKDTLEGKTYFRANRDRLDPDKRYTFVMRHDTEQKQKKLGDFYAVCSLPHIKIKISFSPIDVIVKNPHMV
jgi:hypothetical protein